MSVLLFLHLTPTLPPSHLHTHSSEDIDPSVGKFRNMVQTTIVPTKVRTLSCIAPMQCVCAVALLLTALFLYLYRSFAWKGRPQFPPLPLASSPNPSPPPPPSTLISPLPLPPPPLHNLYLGQHSSPGQYQQVCIYVYFGGGGGGGGGGG